MNPRFWNNFRTVRQNWSRHLGSNNAWADLRSIWYGRGACVLTCSATQKCQMIPLFMKWKKKELFLKNRPNWVETYQNRLVLILELKSLVALACSEMALRAMFHFGFRVVEILEQNLDKFGTGFWGSNYAWAGLLSIWYGKGPCVLIKTGVSVLRHWCFKGLKVVPKRLQSGALSTSRLSEI